MAASPDATVTEGRTRTAALGGGAAIALLWVSLAPSLGAAASGSAPPLAFPLSCRVGETCWIGNYVDLDPGPQARDWRCGRMTYDGHDGTDFALRDLAQMREGVGVLAAADGVVKAIRDGVADVSVKEGSQGAVKGRECGNGVLLTHPGGWSTQYCHLRRGSVRVKPGETVEAGRPLGSVGLSGKTEYPHLHFVVRLGDQVLDPFSGSKKSDRCEEAGAPLWGAAQPPLQAYAAGALYNAGLATRRPSAPAVRNGEFRAVRPRSADARIYLWAEAFGVQPDDRVSLSLREPEGELVINSSAQVERPLARIFRFAGAERRGAEWRRGAYAARIEVRGGDGRLLSERAWTFQLD